MNGRLNRPPEADGRERLAWRTALAFVVITLAALVVIPLLVRRKVAQHRADIEAAEPARTLIMALQFNLVHEMSALNEYALAADSQSAQTFRAARSRERQIWRDLAPLAAALGVNVQERYAEARATAEVWHERLHEDELLRRGRAGLAILSESHVRQRFDAVLNTTARVDSAIVEASDRGRARIRGAERTGLQYTFVSGALALIAAATIGALALRIRRLAAESELRRRAAAHALAETAHSTEARRKLLRGVTHDVKNPLGAAHGYAELLALGVKGSLNPEQEKLVQGMKRSIDGALTIISDLLDLAKDDTVGISVNPEPADLNEIARQAVADQRAAAEAAGHEIVLQTASGPLSCHTDPARIRQVLDNLISNAIKYTPPPGRITLRTEANAQDAPFALRSLAIRVEDTGPGIPPDRREEIFDEFTRLDEAGTKKGHGLGLPNARRIARLLGGELGLADETSQGSTFVLWLPQHGRRAAA